MNYWLNILDKILNNLVDAILPSWPQLCLILGLLIILLFRKNISGLIDRITRISNRGIICGSKQDDAPQPLDKKLGKPETTVTAWSKLKTIQNNIHLIETYLSNKKLEDLKNTRTFLINDLAEVYFALRCEKIYRIIFGSQIQLLNNLLQSKSTRLTEQVVNEYFEDISKTYPDAFARWDKNSYLYFLLQAELISFQKDYYKITDFGSDFLTWIKRSGLPENKLF